MKKLITICLIMAAFTINAQMKFEEETLGFLEGTISQPNLFIEINQQSKESSDIKKSAITQYKTDCISYKLYENGQDKPESAQFFFNSKNQICFVKQLCESDMTDLNEIRNELISKGFQESNIKKPIKDNEDYELVKKIWEKNTYNYVIILEQNTYTDLKYLYMMKKEFYISNIK